jgi:Tfp pilus assembly protein PilF
MALRLIVGGAEEKRVRLKGSAQMAAYDYLVQARELFFRFARETNTEARTLLVKALGHDPHYAQAWSYLAWSHIQDFRRSWSNDPDQSFALAKEAARKALALDPRDYFNHWPTAFLLIYSRRYDEGIAEYQKAIALNPNESRLLDDFAEGLCMAGRPEEAITQIQLAMRLDPLHPDWFYGTLGFAYYQMRKYDDAVAAMAKMINTPGGVWLFMRAAAYAQLGRIEEARETLAEYLRQRSGRPLQKEATYPLKNPADLEHLLDGLRKAGMPE